MGSPDRGQRIYTYHPDFMNRHPAYFDVLERNTLQLGKPHRASTDVGAAAIARDLEKDNKHAGSVEEVGRHFFLLITKTLEVWTSSSFLLLCAFTERTNLCNSLSPLKSLPTTLGKVVVIQCQDDPTALWSHAIR